jgi:AraC-like DNA-binding protein
VNQTVLNATEHQIFLIGIQRSPAIIGSTATNTRTIGIELTPKGLYHFFKLNMYEVTDHMVSFEELFGPWGVRLQNRVGDADDPKEKIALLQAGLTQILHQDPKEYALLDHAIDLIAQTHGMLTIRELAAQVGYSKRYVDVLFKDHVGLSPKSLASILRFQESYQVWTRQTSPTSFRNSLPAYYYDQAHFIKEFKRYTGFTPHHYQEITNEFGRAFTTKQ